MGVLLVILLVVVLMALVIFLRMARTDDDNAAPAVAMKNMKRAMHELLSGRPPKKRLILDADAFSARLDDVPLGESLRFVVVLEQCQRCRELEETWGDDAVLVDGATIRNATGHAKAVVANIGKVPTPRVATRRAEHEWDYAQP